MTELDQSPDTIRRIDPEVPYDPPRPERESFSGTREDLRDGGRLQQRPTDTGLLALASDPQEAPATAPGPAAAPVLREEIASNLKDSPDLAAALIDYLNLQTRNGSQLPFLQAEVEKKREEGPTEALALAEEARKMELKFPKEEKQATREVYRGRGGLVHGVTGPQAREVQKLKGEIDDKYSDALEAGKLWLGDLEKLERNGDLERARAEQNLKAKLLNLVDVDGKKVFPVEPDEFKVRMRMRSDEYTSGVSKAQIVISYDGLEAVHVFKPSPDGSRLNHFYRDSRFDDMRRTDPEERLNLRIQQPSVIADLERVIADGSAAAPYHSNANLKQLQTHLAERLERIFTADYGLNGADVKVELARISNGRLESAVVALGFSEGGGQCTTKYLFRPPSSASDELVFKGATRAVIGPQPGTTP